MNAIETVSLTKFYGKSRGINDIDLTVAEGDFFGFIGPNGAGKSTTIRILTRLISQTSGEAKIFGKDAGKTDVLADIGYMPSEVNFYHGMKVREVIKYSAELRKRNCAKEASRLCERLELDINKKISELSLGNRKKVSIVCALQHNPRLCILDEPTSGLDPLMQREFYAILQERNSEGATIFLSSHILSEIQKYCKRAAVIREGRLLVCDRVEKLVHTNAKKVTLSGISEPPKLDGIGKVEVDGGTVKFLYGGKPCELLNALALLPITDIGITEPDLEEIFMHYYAEGKNDNS